MFGRIAAWTMTFALVSMVGSLVYRYYQEEGGFDGFFNTPAVSQEPVKVASSTLAAKPVLPEDINLKPTVVATPATSKASLEPGTLYAKNLTSTDGALTLKGVIVETNKARALTSGLPALTENELLNKDAQIKLEDMFANQYFEHVSPTGVGPATLAKRVGYAYVIVGENLALGDFGNDAGVVDAWMNSPGHRANILNTKYQEIGVAVGKGLYEGRETWLAVQSFGMPLSACPAIDVTLKVAIDTNNAEILRSKDSIDAKMNQVQNTPQNDPNYNTYVSEYNTMIKPYNEIVAVNRELVSKYNTQVAYFNTCVNEAGAH